MKRIKFIVASLLLITTVAAEVTITASAASRKRPQTTVPSNAAPRIDAPAGYGHYCSVVYPDGRWTFMALGGTNTDPCREIRKSRSGGTVHRAGLWAVNGGNNVLARCGVGDLRIYGEMGDKPLKAASDESGNKRNCVFTVAPWALPIFKRPYGRTPGTPTNTSPDADVTVGRGFDYNVYNISMDARDFGQTRNASHPVAHWVDREGKQRCFINSKGEHVDGEAAYDWNMPEGKPILAVANGIVRSARGRNVSQFGCGNDFQKEIYI